MMWMTPLSASTSAVETLAEFDAMMLTPLIDEERFGFKAGQTMSAADVLRKILPAAQKHKDLPT